MSILVAVSFVLLAVGLFGLAASAFQAFLTWWYVRQGPKLQSSQPGISILKPLCGVDDGLEKNLELFATLPYPNYELLLGVKNEKDPAYPLAVAATQRWPDRVRLYLQRGEPGLNPKVNQLCTLQDQARFDLLLISDSNCRPFPGYLEEIAAEFEDPQVACVTNPIVGVGEQKLGSLLDNFHLGSTIASGMIAAKLAPIPHDIVVGKSMALRKSALLALGGFYAARNHLAEDYVLGRGIHDQLGMKIAHCKLPVVQISQNRTLRDFLNRQKRWCVIHRTAIAWYTYVGEGLMSVTPWVLLGALLNPTPQNALLFLAVWAAKSSLDALNTRQFRPVLFGAMTPVYALLKDLIWTTAWAYGLFVRTVTWRGNKLVVQAGSQLIPPTPELLPLPLPAPVAEPAYVPQERHVA
ncbi:MAG: glycosyltransferase [Myxococcota bacterium]|nr:glycosyltransferase [Myxococcota bacterium]